MSMRSDDLEIAFVGGEIFDGVSASPVRTDVGVSSGCVTALGHDEVASRRGSATRVVDLTGRLLLPGFIDAHVHPIEGGTERLACDLSGGSTREEYLDVVARYVRSHEDLAWVVGGGWAQAAFPGGAPRAEDLDRICDDRPVVLSNRDHHSVWVNSRALALAEVDARTPDPPDGRIERDADGTPTGTLHEGARTRLLRLLPPDATSRLYDGLIEGQRYLHSVGVTGWQDALIGDYGSHSNRYLEVYRQAIERGELTARVNGALWWDRDRGTDQVEELVATRARHQHELFRVSSVKIMQDGVPENRTAAVLDPYLRPGCCGGGRAETGISFIDPERLRDHVRLLDQEGFQVHFHAIGDRAVRECLDAVSAAREANEDRGPTHHIAHVQIVHPDDVPRFPRLRVAANIQPLWAAYDPQMVELNLPLLGAERAARQYPFASFDSVGTHLCAGSDWPVTSADPWLGIHLAVNRRHPAHHPDRSPDVFLPEQRLTLDRVLRAYTSGSARINGRDHYTGAIRRGYAADLTVADRNPFDGPEEVIGETRTDETFVAGVSVYQRDTSQS